MTDRPTCETCAYFESHLLPPADFGQCRKRAPRPNDDTKEHAGTNWPLVGMADWCGEFMSPEVTVVFDETSGADDNLPKTLGRAR